jgi:hypothetical protein
MSWDISIQHLPEGVATIDEIPDDFTPAPLGPRSEVITDILRVVPDIDFTDSTWGMLERPTFSIEFNMGSEAICSGFMLHVRGGGDAMRLIDELLSALKLRGLDCQSGDFFRLDAAEETFEGWQQFRERVVSQTDSDHA